MFLLTETLSLIPYDIFTYDSQNLQLIVSHRITEIWFLLMVSGHLWGLSREPPSHLGRSTMGPCIATLTYNLLEPPPVTEAGHQHCVQTVQLYEL